MGFDVAAFIHGAKITTVDYYYNLNAKTNRSIIQYTHISYIHLAIIGTSVYNFIIVMDLKKYKMCRSKNFPLPQHSASKYSIDSESLISTTAIISNPPSASYNIHYDQSSGDVIMFNEH